VPNKNYLWKIKILLKIKVFLWLLYREAILIKDNLVKRIWHENVKCCFYDSLKTIQHLLFDCSRAKFIWRVIQITFGLSTPNNIKHVLGGWIQRMKNKDRKLLLVGLGTILWSIWLRRNDIVLIIHQFHLTCMLYSGRPTGQERGRCSKRKNIKWSFARHAG
jgi:hypothetical protein